MNKKPSQPSDQREDAQETIDENGLAEEDNKKRKPLDGEGQQGYRNEIRQTRGQGRTR